MKYLAIFLSLLLTSATSYSQEVISSKQTKKSDGLKKHFLHFHNDLIIFEKTPLTGDIYKPKGTLEVYKGKKKIIKNFNTKTKFNNDYSTVVDYLFQEQSFFTLNDSREGNVITIHLQEFDYDFKKLGDPIKLAEIDSEMNKGLQGGNYGIIGIRNSYLEKHMEFTYHKESGRYLLTVIANMYNRIGYLEMFVFDSDFSLITSHSIKAENEKDRINIKAITALPHGEFLTILSETSGSKIKEFYLFHLFDNGDYYRDDLSPDQSTLIDVQFSNYGVDDKIIISILSQDSNGNLSKGSIKNYTYDFISPDLTEKSIDINIEDLIKSDYNNLTTMEMQSVNYLKDQSLVVQLCETNYSYGNDVESSLSSKNMVILKIDNANDLAWIKPIERFGSLYGLRNIGASLDYLTNNNNLEIIFNASQRDFKDGFYAPNNFGAFNKKGTSVRGLPVKAKINLANGDIEIKLILSEKLISDFSFGNAKEMGETGVYKMFIKNAGEYHVLHIDFKDQ